MAIITCPECGKEISDKAEVCIHCGFPLKQAINRNQIRAEKTCPECGEKVDINTKVCPKCAYPFPKKNPLKIDMDFLKNKKVIGIFAGFVAVVVLLFIIVGISSGNKFGKAKKLYKGNDLESYTEMKSEMKADDVAKFSDMLISDINDIKSDYILEKITYEDAISSLENILSYSDTTHLTNYVDTKSFIDKLYKSRNAYESAVSAEKESNYQVAYDNYSKVIEDDSNYGTAQSKIREMQTSLCKECIDSAKNYALKDDYSNAISALNKAKKYDESNTEIDDLLAQYKKIQEDAKKKAEEEARAKAMMEEGKVIMTNNMTTTFVKAELTDHIYPDVRSGYYTYYSVSETGTTWLDLKFKVKNTGNGILNLNTMVRDVVATYDTDLEYKTYGLYYSTGKNIDQIYEYFSNSIDPLQEVTLHVIIEMPVEAKTSGKSLEVELTMDGEKQILIYQ